MKHSKFTAPQRAKLRKLEKSYDEVTDPISRAMYKHEQDVRSQAWKELDCAGRIKELEAQYLPQIKAIEEQRKALWEQEQELTKQLSDLRSDIQVEAYQVVYNDPEYKAMRAIMSQARQAHEAKMKELIAEFEQANAEVVA